jgi:NADH-quinone oxidoreductase subunit M
MQLLTWLLLIPALGAVVIGFVPVRTARAVAAAAAGLTLLVSLALLGYGSQSGGNLFQFKEEKAWLPALGIGYTLGVDGPALLLIVLTALLHFLAVIYSYDRITFREKEFYALVLALEATVIGAFSALDLVLFYVFFDACLVPAYFLIGIWGGRGRIRAGTKFFVYTVVGSLLMLASIIGLFLVTGSFGVQQVQAKLAASPLPLPTALLIFGGFAIAFAIKTGLFPFHTWLPDAYAEAPPAVAALLSGVLAKLGTYGFYRFGISLLPEAARDYAPFLVGLGVVSILYGALVASAQRDTTRVIAYSSVSHLGFVVAGLFALTPQALSGAFLQMVNHGITSAGLFFLVGMIADRRGTTHMRALGGLWEQMPLFGRIFLIVTLASIGLPLTNGFVGEFLILLGTFQTFPWLAAAGTTGVIASAVYMLSMFQKVMYGPAVWPEVRRMPDVSQMELAVVIPLVLLIFLLGVQPGWLQDKLDPAVGGAISRLAPPPTETLPGGQPLPPALPGPISQ